MRSASTGKISLAMAWAAASFLELAWALSRPATVGLETQSWIQSLACGRVAMPVSLGGLVIVPSWG